MRIISTLFQPLMFLAIFGAGLQGAMAGGNFGLDFVQFMYPGIIAMSVMGVAFFSTISTVWDREFGFLKEILVSPTSRSAIAIGKALGATFIAALQGIILFVIAPIVGVKLSFSMLPGLILFMILVAFAISGMGLLIASLMKTTESFGLLMQLLIMPMFFLSGAFFPLTNVPIWMTVISNMNPLTYGVDALRQILLKGQAPAAMLQSVTLNSLWANALFLVAFLSVMVGAAVFAFNRRG